MAASLLPIHYFRIRGLCVKKLPILHANYGPVVRIAPNELSYIEPQAWEDIYTRTKLGKLSFPKDATQFGPGESNEAQDQQYLYALVLNPCFLSPSSLALSPFGSGQC